MFKSAGFFQLLYYNYTLNISIYKMHISICKSRNSKRMIVILEDHTIKTLIREHLYVRIEFT